MQRGREVLQRVASRHGERPHRRVEEPPRGGGGASPRLLLRPQLQQQRHCGGVPLGAPLVSLLGRLGVGEHVGGEGEQLGAGREGATREALEEPQRALALDEAAHVGRGGHDGAPQAVDRGEQQPRVGVGRQQRQHHADAAHVAKVLLELRLVDGEQREEKQAVLQRLGGQPGGHHEGRGGGERRGEVRRRADEVDEQRHGPGLPQLSLHLGRLPRGNEALRGVREQPEPHRAQLGSECARLEQVRQHGLHEAHVGCGQPQRRELGQVAQ